MVDKNSQRFSHAEKSKEAVVVEGSSTALAFATDETFAPLAKGLVLSILDSKVADFTLYLIDIGCGSDTIDWMKAHGVQVSTFERAKYLKVKIDAAVKRYQDAQLCRPFLPSMFPGHEVYVWCDSDIWIQNIKSLQLFRDIADKFRDRIPLSPLIDVSYKFHYADGTEFMRYAKHWFQGCYGLTVAESYADKAILSSGVFAMHKDNPIWDLWAAELGRVYARGFQDHYQSHLAEQTVLSYLAYSRSALVPVEAIHNYNCHIGSLVRLGGKVVIEDLPHREVGIVHLTYSSKMLPDYIKAGFLYRAGDYLSSAERASLAAISHY